MLHSKSFHKEIFPLMSGAVQLPFPRNYIKELCICVLTDNPDDPLPPFSVTGVEVSGASITLTICLGTVFLCSLTAPSMGYSKQVKAQVVYKGVKYTTLAFMQAGSIAEDKAGTYKLDALINVSCTVRMPSRAHRVIGGIKINGLDVAVPEFLRIRTAGYIKGVIKPKTDSVDAYDFSVVLAADIPNNADLFYKEYADEDYDMVRTVNQLPFGGMYASDPEDYTKTLTVCVRPYAKDESSVAPVITYKVLNATDYSTGVGSSSGDNRDGSTIIELNGTSHFPHCYGDKDEADSKNNNTDTTNQGNWNPGTGYEGGVPGYITGNPDWLAPAFSNKGKSLNHKVV